MHCHEFEERMQLLLDHRLAPSDDAPLRSHAQACPACADMLRAEARLFGGLKPTSHSLVGFPERTAFSERIVAAHQQQQQRQTRTWRRLGLFSALSTVAVCGWLAFSWVPLRTNLGTAATQSLPSPPTNTAQLAIADAAKEKLTREQLIQYQRALESLASQIGDKQRLEDVNASLQPSLRPLRSSFGLAIDALRRTLPRGKDGRPVRPTDGAALPPETSLVG